MKMKNGRKGECGMNQEWETLLRQIDLYIEESQDENFDRYLAQMKEILMAQPQRTEEIRQAVARNMERYRANVRRQQKTSMEFKIGAGVLSGIGIVFVVAALVILVRNFMPPFVQGMAMFAFFALVWLISQMGLMRAAKKLALGLTGASVVGLYLSVAVNFHEFHTLPPYWAQGLLVLVAVLSWLNGRVIRSAVLQCMSFGGYLFFFLFLPWEEELPLFILLLVTMAGLNLMWNLGAAGERRDLVRLVHTLCFGVVYLIYGMYLFFDMTLLGDEVVGVLPILIYHMLMLGLLNLFYIKSAGPGMFAAWMSFTVVELMIICSTIVMLQCKGDFVTPQWLLALIGVNLFLLLWQKFRWYGMGVYFQSFFLLLFLVGGELMWPGIAAAVVLFAAGLLCVREKQLAHELIMSLYFLFFLFLVVPAAWIYAARMALLLVITALCLYVPRLRAKKPAALVYTNVSLMGTTLLGLGMERLRQSLFYSGSTTVLGEGVKAGQLPNYIPDTVVLVLSVLAVLVLWRKRCYLPGRLQGLMLVLVLTYMVFIYRIEIPVAASIALMVVAVVAIITGFVRKETALRIYGLILSLFVCAKVVLYDYWDLELFSKSILLLVVGLIAIAISIVYAVLEHAQRKKMPPKRNYGAAGPYPYQYQEGPASQMPWQAGQDCRAAMPRQMGPEAVPNGGVLSGAPQMGPGAAPNGGVLRDAIQNAGPAGNAIAQNAEPVENAIAQNAEPAENAIVRDVKREENSGAQETKREDIVQTQTENSVSQEEQTPVL